MPSNIEKTLYEYAVVRYVPSIEREEFINIGIVMMCKRKRWIKTRLHIDENRISALFADADIEMLKSQCKSFELIASGKGDNIASYEAHERFRWLTAIRSACIGTSRPHPGKCSDLDATFDKLFAEQVCSKKNNDE